MDSRSILFIDDDREILKIYKAYMEKKGYRVFTCASGSEALACLEKESADCIILDVMMPGEDGFSLLPKLRKISDAPVLFLSGKTESADRILGLRLGADDYIVKPCSLEELFLRIGINIRKKEGIKQNDILHIPPLTLSLTDRKVWCGDQEIFLSGREYELLVLFTKNPGTTLTFEKIGIFLNGAYLAADRQTVMMTVSRLRKKLEAYAKAASLIETVWGEGYRLRA